MNAIRRLKRNVAKNRMKKKGLRKICKNEKDLLGNRHGSWFADNWRDYVKGSVSNG